MKSVAEIIFVGLCSFLNVHDTVKYDMPSPSVIVMNEDDHTPFIAFDSDEVEAVDGNGKPIGNPVPGSTALKYIVLQGEELVLLNGPSGVPRVAESFDAVASASMYAPESKSDTYDEDYVPKQNGKPKKSAVSAFLMFGGGSLGRGRLTAVPYVFQTVGGGDQTIAGRFAEEVIYSFPADRIRLSAVDLEDPARTRSLAFLPKNLGQGVPTGIRVWIGAAADVARIEGSGIAGTIRGKQHGPYLDAGHMVLFNKMFKPATTTAKKKVKDRVPHPVRDWVVASAAPKGSHAKGLRAEESGYCGPDQKP